MGVKLGAMQISQFANGETRIWVSEEKIEREVVVVQSLSTPTNDHLIEFCLICDALYRGGAREIMAVIPWMGYSKQDKVFRHGEPLSAKVVAQIIQTSHIAKIITFDLHNRATLGFFDAPIVELSAKSLLIDYFKVRVREKKSEEEVLVVAPDSGAVKNSTAFATELGLSVVYMDKKRDLETGKVTVVGMSRSVAGATAIIVDDNIFTGSTLIETVKELKKAGAKKILVGVTHHLYVSGVQEKIEESGIDELVVTDSVERKAQSEKSGKLKTLSLSGLIVDELR